MLVACALGCGHSPAPTDSEATSSPAIAADRTQPASAAKASPAGASGTTVRAKGQGVAASLQLSRQSAAPGSQIELTVELEIAPQWEVRALGASAAGGVPTTLDLTLPPGVSAAGDWVAPPAARSISPDGHPVYAGKATFKRTLAVEQTATAGETPVTCKIGYQACNERTCLRPETVELSAPLAIAQP